MSIKIISRGKGKSAVAAAAYRAGEKITNSYDGITHDYTRKGGVAHTEILLPENAPAAYADRAILWNEVEQAEKAKNAQLAREIELALPVELSPEQNISLVREYVKEHFVSAGMCADICIHDKEDGNPHAHVMLTMRPFDQDGSWAAKSRKEYILDKNGERIRLKSGAYKSRKVDATAWNDQGKAEVWRAAWADMVNHALERQGMAERIDHHSYERQGVEQIPTIHMGVAAMQMEKRGIRTQRGERNREVGKLNRLLRQFVGKIIRLKNWVTEKLKPAVPVFAARFAEATEKAKAGAYFTACDQSIMDDAFEFLKENNISSTAELDDMMHDLHDNLYTVRHELRDTEQRMSELDKLIENEEIYGKHKVMALKYRQLKPRKQLKFRLKHETELLLFESAEQYLKQRVDGTIYPVSEWKNEREKLAAATDGLYQRYHGLQEEVKHIEAVQRTVNAIMRQPKKERAIHKKRDRGMER